MGEAEQRWGAAAHRRKFLESSSKERHPTIAMTTWIAIALAAAALWYYMFRFGKVSPAEARQRVGQGARLIDVRTPEEFEGGHLPGAVNVPLSDLRANADRAGPEDAEYVLYCASGARSAVAARALKAAGRQKVFDLGSIGRW